MPKKSNPTVGEGILGQNKDKIGTYLEAPGGGTPLAAGEKAPSKAWVEANRVMQPRDADGKFTYNSANAKPLKYGPSRGTTIPPFLKGVKMTYAIKAKDVIIGEKGKTYLAGIDMTANDIINAYKEWSGEGFKSLQGKLKGKVGAKSKVEKEAIAKGELGLLYGNVIDSYEKFKQKPNKPKMKPTVFKPKQEVKQEPVAEVKSEQPAAEQPKVEESGAKYGNLGQNEFDLAKNDEKGFVSKYKNELKSIQDLAKSKGYKEFNLKGLIGMIGSGEFKNWSEIKEQIV